MSKVSIFSDIHIYPHKKSQQRLDDCLDVLDWILSESEKRNILNVIFLGDLFHDRTKIQVYAYDRTFHILKKFKGHIWMLLGNHDLWYYEKTDISSVMPLSALSNVTVIDKPKTLNIDGYNWDFIPFVFDPIKVIKEVFDRKSDFLGAHIAIDKALLNVKHKIYSEISIENETDVIPVSVQLFSEWRKGFLGHFHCSQVLDNLEYVGSPLQLDFSEASQNKHFIIFDQKTLEVEYVENTFSPKHLILDSCSVFNENLNNNFVKVEVDVNNVSTIDIRNKLDCNARSIEFKEIRKNVEIKPELQEKFNFASGDVLNRWVEANGCGDLDKSMLLKIGIEICGE